MTTPPLEGADSGTQAQPNIERSRPGDPGRMELTSKERRWAWVIRRAIESSPEIDNISDFVCCQIAQSMIANFEDHHHEGGVIDLEIDDDTVEQTVENALRMQIYREDYGILDTYEDGIKSVAELLRIIPTTLLSFSFNCPNYVFIYDLAAIPLNEMFKKIENVKRLMKGFYYMANAFYPDIEANRRGAILVSECEGFDWRKNISVTTARRLWGELATPYPNTIQRIKYFHTGVFINLLNSIKRGFLPKRVMAKMDTACQFDGHLSEIFFVPTMDSAHQLFQRNVELSLRLRYSNIETFRFGVEEGKCDDVDRDLVATMQEPVEHEL